MTTREKLFALRNLMRKHRIAAYSVPSTDPHLSEYLPECWKRRAWLSGFTGSAGDLLVGLRRAALWTDGRYFLQAEEELAGSGIDLMRLGEPETPQQTEWLLEQVAPGDALGVDPSVLATSVAERLETALRAAGRRIRCLAANLVDELWTDRPAPGTAPLKLHASRLAGETVASKLARVREELAEERCYAHVIGALDAIAWLFNVRGADILYTPVAIAYAIVTRRGATLFVDPAKVTAAIKRQLGRSVTFRPYEAFWEALSALADQSRRVWIDPETTNWRIVRGLKGADLYRGPSPIMAFKAVKNPVQIQGIVAAHVRDGAAMVRFLRWLPEAVPQGGVTEISAAQKLYELRAEDRAFEDLSFTTISGYGANGAIVHYSVDERTNAILKPRGLYLIDSGGQYPDGTTDITRTVSLGRPTRYQRECFTRVLMGMIDCTTTPFPSGTAGYRQEMFARKHLWRIGKDYNHGTGHGVGHYLGVHEGPHSLKNIITPPLVAGNLLSIEPGYYEAGKFGIRIENLAVVQKDEVLSTADHTWYRFWPVTLCPIDLSLVNPDLMSADQIAWLNDYHRRVYRELAPELEGADLAWLKAATRPLAR